MKRTFFISGLGANERAFEKLKISKLNSVFLPWLKSEANESLESYSKRLIHEFDITQDDVLVGLSFGGIVAQQIALILGLKYVILISSFRTKEDLNKIFQFGLRNKLFRLMPSFKFPIISEAVAITLNAGSPDSKPIIKEMLDQTDMEMVKWSIQKIYELDQPIKPEIIKYNVIGTQDRIIDMWKNETTYEIEGGSHFMVYEKADEVSRILNQIISKET